MLKKKTKQNAQFKIQ